MSISAIAMMIVICGLVWGGFVACILFVMRREREKAAKRG
jgi:hypothetical protein